MLRKDVPIFKHFKVNYFCWIMLCIFLWSCSERNNYNDNCNFLLNVGVNVSLNLNLAQYNQLNFPTNPVYVPGPGNGGIIVNNTGTGYIAFDAADPNNFSDCAILNITGIEGICGCDDTNTVYLQSTPTKFQFTLLSKPYRVERIGNELFISN